MNSASLDYRVWWVNFSPMHLAWYLSCTILGKTKKMVNQVIFWVLRFGIGRKARWPSVYRSENWGWRGAENKWGCKDFRPRSFGSESRILSNTPPPIVQITETIQSTHVCKTDKNKGVRKARGGLELFIQLPMCEDTGCGRIWICFLKENPCILLDHRCEEQQEDIRMARGERLALMDVVENTRDFAGKENFQVAKQLRETLYKRGASISWTRVRVRAYHGCHISWIPHKFHVKWAQLWKKIQKVRENQGDETACARSGRPGVVELRTECRQLASKLVPFVPSQSVGVQTLRVWRLIAPFLYGNL